jgi:serine/threonine kinase 33
VAHTRLAEGASFEQRYELGRLLGRGSFGEVVLAVSRATGERLACKMIDKKEAGSAAVRQLEREVNILKRVRHAHVVTLHEVLETPKRIFLVMELCDGGDLLSLLRARKRFAVHETHIVVARLSNAISYLHERDIVHRDLKLDNILLSRAVHDDPLNIKLTDFGLSYILGKENMMQTVCGTPIYMAPEVIGGTGYSQSCDIWSMGVIMYFLLAGRPPFFDTNEAALYEQISRGEPSYQDELWMAVPEAARHLLGGLLRVRRVNGDGWR